MCARWLGAPMSRGREKGAAQQPVHSPIRWILLLGTVGWSNIKTDQAWTFCCSVLSSGFCLHADSLPATTA